ncbi:MAG: hypothetical protein IIA03_00430 [Proteobacteria bacterium]|nr:hypothetical protein [Pseudomonadota bacterium]
MAETVKRGMRYQIFNTPAEEGAAAVVQAPWRWLAVLLALAPWGTAATLSLMLD